MVENLLRGDDNMVRAAVVKVVSGKGDQLQRLRRPMQNLIPIEVRANERPDSISRNNDHNASNEEVRPRREAAVIGELKRISAYKLVVESVNPGECYQPFHYC